MKHNLFILFIIIGILLTAPVRVYPQQLQLKAGSGYFEGFNAGMAHHFNRYLLEYGIGNDLNLSGQGYFNSLHLSLGRTIFEKQIRKENPVYLNLKSILWNVDNTSNVFTSVTLSAELMKQFRLAERYQAGIYAGYAWSGVIRYKRKNYEDVGFIKVWHPNFGISIYRKLR